MVNEGIVLGHNIFERGIEVDKAKVDAIEIMPCHYCRMLLTRHYDQTPFDETVCDAISQTMV